MIKNEEKNTAVKKWIPNIHLICGCGAEIYNLEDILCHFRDRGFKRGVILLLTSKIKFSRKSIFYSRIKKIT